MFEKPAQTVFRGILYVCVWAMVALACGFLGAWWPMRNVSDAGPGAGFSVLLYGAFGLCLGAGIGLIAVGGLATLLSARNLASEARIVAADPSKTGAD